MDDTPQPGSRVVAKFKSWFKSWFKLRIKRAGRRESVNSSPQLTDKRFPEKKPSSTPKNLWNQAYDELDADEEHTKWIKGYEDIVKKIAKDENIPEYSTVKDQMEAVARTRMKFMTSRQWVLQWGSKSINLRRLVDKIVQVIQKGSSIGSQIASLDPTYGSIAWTGICIVLPVRNPLFRVY
jgi:hypothetical protein